MITSDPAVVEQQALHLMLVWSSVRAAGIRLARMDKDGEILEHTLADEIFLIAYNLAPELATELAFEAYAKELGL